MRKICHNKLTKFPNTIIALKRHHEIPRSELLIDFVLHKIITMPKALQISNTASAWADITSYLQASDNGLLLKGLTFSISGFKDHQEKGYKEHAIKTAF